MEFRTYSIRMRTRFRGLENRQGMLAEGPAGWAEFSPFPEYDHVASLPWLQAAMEAATKPWPEPVRASVPVNGIVPAVGDGADAARRAVESGCNTIKLKVAEKGETLEDDIERVAAIRDALPHALIRIDANGGWSVKDAVKAIKKLDYIAGGLEYVEQPCATVEELAQVRRKVAVPIAADESIRRAADPFRVRDLDAADVAVLKVQPLGGVRACLRIAEQIGMPVSVSSAVETSIGLAASVALAAALPELPYACGIGTAHLLTSDVVTHPLKPVDGHLYPTRPVLDEEAFALVAAPPETDERWQARLAHVREML
ncbi:o-succinylbenzoate synthase [Aeromicrobium duanguangcaii]|uniref:o-succinylbenzoate synthase n=1 Tax=Aeromicrobium duanguangcaii TaxID=2968086 RepID=A0ABY5KHI3_9ACTN|nr:o-succinylbenzoate synthase [Aeromicrobium duanguangcaii]UUI68906.1 o-succinylbenzoate synthase [Aeromicrobium duanguangcaii]